MTQWNEDGTRKGVEGGGAFRQAGQFQTDSQAISIISYLVTGPAFFGGIGWLLDRFLGTGFLVPLGVVGGMALSIYLIWFRYGRTGENPPG